MSIPLVQNNEKDSINTSIIAIKRNIERINMLLGLSNSEEIDTSEFVKKSDIVDEVTLDNMQSVTSNAVAKAMSYSTEEVFTGKYWIDGKPIYSKVVDCGNLPNNAGKTVNHGISNLSKIINWDGNAYIGNSTYRMPTSDGTNFINTYITRTQVTIYTNWNASASTGIVIIEYTKATD